MGTNYNRGFNPAHKGKRQYFCEHCNAEVWTYPSQLNARTFCSHRCRGQFYAGHPRPTRKRSVTKACEQCGELFTRMRCKAEQQKFCSLACNGASIRGEKHYAWRGGQDWRQTLLNSGAYDLWRKRVLLRDRGRCRWCFDEGRKRYANLEVHHIIPASACPERVLDVDNGIALCRPHHSRTKMRESEFAEYLSGLVGAPLVGPPADAIRRVKISADELRGLYWDDCLSTHAIARLKECHPTQVQKMMKKFGIPKRSNSEAGKLRANRSSVDGVSRGGRDGPAGG